MRDNNIILGRPHQGGALQNMVKEYPTNPSVLKEMLQNSVDIDFGGASKVLIDINFDNATIGYFDNGPGLTPETFEAAVKTFGHSIKRGDKYGKFGIGLISPLAIVEEFHFVTACSGAPYVDYEFNRKRLFEVADGGYPIPARTRRDLFHGDGHTPGVRPRFAQNVWWRTAVTMKGLTDDKQKRRLDIESFQADIQSAYGKKLVELGTKITIKVTEGGVTKEIDFKAKLYQGKKLPVWSKKFDDVGLVTVALHLSPIGYVGPQRIDVGPGDNPSRVEFGRLRLSRLYECLGEKTKGALNSKLFQGEIIGENLKLLASRRGFANDDALFAFAIALDTWYEQIGHQYHEDQKRETKANRFQAISLEVIERLKGIFASDSPFASVLAQACFGSIGKGHSPVPAASIVKGMQLGAKALVGEKVNFDGESPPRGEPQGERPGHQPKVAVGPGGQTRQVTQGHSAGFHIVMNDTGERMWHYNASALCLTVNDTHPVFHAVERRDEHLRQYIMMAAMSALRLELQQDERLKDANHEYAEGNIRDWVEHVLH